MLLNVDRRRIYIFSGVGFFLILMLALYHAPAYVPAEVSRMKTSVSTWLKGTEPSLNDELYKDSPHFSSSTKPHQQATSDKTNTEQLFEEEADPYEIKDASGEEAFHTLPIDTPEIPDILPPSDSKNDDKPQHSSHDDTLPAAKDFIGVLPPVDVLSGVSLESEPTHTSGHAKATGNHPHLEEVTSPTPESTTFATHTKSVSSVWQPHDALPTDTKDIFEFDKWYDGEDGSEKKA